MFSMKNNVEKVNEGGIAKESSLANKTGTWRIMKPKVLSFKCTKCGICRMYCPDSCIDENINIDYNYCKGCLICVKECPFKAITALKEER